MIRPPSLASAAYPVAALLAAWGMQSLGYRPCHLCMMQRMPLMAAAWSGIVATAFGRRDDRIETMFVLFAAIGILSSGAIGAFHAGVEYGWWTYDGSCSGSIVGGGDDMLKRIMSADTVPCDSPQWTILGISMAGMNALVSTLVGITLPIWQNRYINTHRIKGQTA